MKKKSDELKADFKKLEDVANAAKVVSASEHLPQPLGPKLPKPGDEAEEQSAVVEPGAASTNEEGATDAVAVPANTIGRPDFDEVAIAAMTKDVIANHMVDRHILPQARESESALAAEWNATVVTFVEAFNHELADDLVEEEDWASSHSLDLAGPAAQSVRAWWMMQQAASAVQALMQLCIATGFGALADSGLRFVHAKSQQLDAGSSSPSKCDNTKKLFLSSLTPITGCEEVIMFFNGRVSAVPMAIPVNFKGSNKTRFYMESTFAKNHGYQLAVTPVTDAANFDGFGFVPVDASVSKPNTTTRACCRSELLISVMCCMSPIDFVEFNSLCFSM